MKTSELIGPALDWAVAKCEGYTNLRWHTYPALFPAPPSLVMDPPRVEYGAIEFSDLNFSTDWSQGGLIIERQEIELLKWGIEGWKAKDTNYQFLNTSNERDTFVEQYGPTPLIAAMRCYVASKLGDTVDISQELL